MILETIIDEYGRQRCSVTRNEELCNNILTLKGCWYHNERLYTDKFVFSCSKCRNKWSCTAEETELHQDGIELAKKDEQVEEGKQKVINYKNKIHANETYEANEISA